MARTKPVSPRWRPGEAPPGCVGYYLLGERYGTPIRDLSGTAAPGSLISGTTRTVGLYGPQVTAVSTYLADLSGDVLPAPNAGFSLAALVRVANLADGRIFFGGPTGNGGVMFRWLSGNLEIVKENVALECSLAAPAFSAGRWCVPAVTFDGGSFSVYLDGVNLGSAVATPNFLYGVATLGYQKGTGQAFVGDYGAAGIFDRPLSDAEVRVLSADFLSGSFAAARPVGSLPAAVLTPATGGTVNLTVAGIVPTAAVGVPSLARVVGLSVSGTPSTATVGKAERSRVVALAVAGIVSTAAVGAVGSARTVALAASGLVSTLTIGVAAANGPAADADLLEAIWSLLDADAVLTAGFGRQGWLWRSEAPAGEPLPFGVLTPIGREEPELTTTRKALYRQPVQIAVFGAYDDAQTLGSRIEAVLDPRAGYVPLQWDSGREVARWASPSAQAAKDPERGPRGQDVWARWCNYTFLLSRRYS